jgi:hypothetical protein
MERIDEANGRMSLDRTSGLEKGYLVRIDAVNFAVFSGA